MVTTGDEAPPTYTTVTGGVPPVTQQPQPAQPAAGVNLPVTMDGMTDMVNAQRRLIAQLTKDSAERQAALDKLTSVGVEADKLLAALTGGTNVGVVGAGAQSAVPIAPTIPGCGPEAPASAGNSIRHATSRRACRSMDSKFSEVVLSAGSPPGTS